jgi:hypothetical protein
MPMTIYVGCKEWYARFPENEPKTAIKKSDNCQLSYQVFDIEAISREIQCTLVIY